MAQVIVRKLDNDLKDALKRRANQHGWSMEEEVRQILRRAVNEDIVAPTILGTRIASRFADVGLDRPLPELHDQTIDPMALDT